MIRTKCTASGMQRATSVPARPDRGRSSVGSADGCTRGMSSGAGNRGVEGPSGGRKELRPDGPEQQERRDGWSFWW
jgi:hypothetical protein